MPHPRSTTSNPKPLVRVRAKTIAMKRLTKEEIRIGKLLFPERGYWRPKTRGDCANVAPGRQGLQTEVWKQPES